MPLICHKHGKKSYCQPCPVIISFLTLHLYFYRHMDYNISLFRKQPDIKLLLISVMVCQRNKYPLSFFLYCNINSVISISVGPLRNGKPISHICMKFFIQIPPDQSTQILIQPLCINIHTSFPVRLLPVFRKYLSFPKQDVLKTFTLLYHKPEIVSVLRCQALIFPDAF